MLERKLLFPNVIELNFQAGHVIGCNVYLVFDADEWVLIDVGYEESVEELIELIRELDFRSRNARRWLLLMLTLTTVKGWRRPSKS